jgi:hypothetical protein
MEFAKGNAGIERQLEGKMLGFRNRNKPAASAVTFKNKRSPAAGPKMGYDRPLRSVRYPRCGLCVVVGRLGIISELKLIKDVDDTWCAAFSVF